MTIEGTFIADSEIIGISALYRRNHPDHVTYTLYKAFRYEFTVYTKSNIIHLEGPYRYSGESPESSIKFCIAYYKSYLAIIEMCGTLDQLNDAKLLISEARKQAENELDALLKKTNNIH